MCSYKSISFFHSVINVLFPSSDTNTQSVKGILKSDIFSGTQVIGKESW